MPKVNRIYNNDIDIAPIEFTHSYLNSKGFRKRLQNVPADQRNNYYKNIIANANSDIILQKTDPRKAGIFHAMASAIPSLFDKDKRDETKVASYTPNTNKITIPIDSAERYAHLDPDESVVLAHEYGHKIDPVDHSIMIYNEPSNAPKNFQKIHERKQIDWENNKHDRAYAETYADLNALRWDLFKNGIYDIRTGEDFNSEQYDAYIKLLKQNKKNMRIIDQFKKEDLIELMNTVAQNDERKSLETSYYG